MLPLKLRSGSQVGPGTGRYQAGASSRKSLPEHTLTGELSYKPGGSHDAAPGFGVMEKNDRGEWQNCPEHGTSGKQHFVLPLQPLSGELFSITLYRKQTQQGHTGAAGPAWATPLCRVLLCSTTSSASRLRRCTLLPGWSSTLGPGTALRYVFKMQIAGFRPAPQVQTQLGPGARSLPFNLHAGETSVGH